MSGGRLSRSVVAAIAGVMVLGVWSETARAELKDCGELNQQLSDPLRPAAYRIFLDDPSPSDHGSVATSRDAGSLYRIIDRFTSSITARVLSHPAVKARRDATPSPEWRPCPGRVPTIGSFELRVRRDLFQYGVVLEVYGVSEGKNMKLRHAIIPAMYELNGEILQTDDLPLDDPRAAEVAVTRYSSRLQGYLEVAMALRLILAVGKDSDHREQRQIARDWLCDGARLIFGAGGPPPADLAPEQKALLDTLSQHMADLAAVGAAQDVNALLQHGKSAPANAAALLKEACLGARS